MSDDGSMGSSYLLGVVEGFYGNPWAHDERQHLFQQMKGFKMNTYMYAPKHDDKHRHNWRSKYELDELKRLKSLIEVSHENGVDFVFSMSPGLDLRYSCNLDLEQLLDKYMDIKELGCQSFAILFDDINEDLSPEDSRNFESPAHAQASVANFIFEKLGPVKNFLFCPTEYCACFAKPNVGESQYLSSLGKMIHPDIMVMWTGPRVVSRTISVESIEQIRKIFRRPPVIWDNIHANDYDRRRFYLGPVAGRHSDLVGLTAGVLTNPNCQYDFNYVAMHSLAAWHRSFSAALPPKKSTSLTKALTDIPSTACEDEHKSHGAYCPRRALVNALSDWLPSFTQTSQDRIELEDLLLLADFYYLPYEYGEAAFRCVDQLSFCASNISQRGSETWNAHFDSIMHLNQKISRLADRMSRCAMSDSPAAQLLPFLIDISNIFTLAVAYIQFIGDLGHFIELGTYPTKTHLSKPTYEYIDDDLDHQPETAIVIKIASVLPKSELYAFILNEITTPWFPGITMRFSEPSRSRASAFQNSAESDMEFDDATLWPSTDLQRLDDLDIFDDQIFFAINLNIHPLDHASALVVRNNKKALLHLAVRSKAQIASLHSITLILCLVVNILSAMDFEIIEVVLGEGSEPFQTVLQKMLFISKENSFYYVLK